MSLEKKTYKKNGIHVVFIHVYKGRRKWKNYLIKRVIEVEEALKEWFKKH